MHEQISVSRRILWEFLKATTATKTSLENKHLGKSDYFVINAFSSHPLLLTEHVDAKM